MVAIFKTIPYLLKNAVTLTIFMWISTNYPHAHTATFLYFKFEKIAEENGFIRSPTQIKCFKLNFPTIFILKFSIQCKMRKTEPTL